jgi:hypothetical protein
MLARRCWFIAKLDASARSRGASEPGDEVFRYRPAGRRKGAPIGSRRFDYLSADRM